MEIQELAAEVRKALRAIEDPNTEPVRWQEVRDLLWASQHAVSVLRDWQRDWKRNQTEPVTRWDLESDSVRERWMRTPPIVPDCISCGQPYQTEADYWKHYVLEDVEYPNLGNCWKRKAAEYAGRKEGWD